MSTSTSNTISNPAVAGVECPSCGAWAGYRCFTRTGKAASTVHSARNEALLSASPADREIIAPETLTAEEQEALAALPTEEEILAEVTQAASVPTYTILDQDNPHEAGSRRAARWDRFLSTGRARPSDIANWRRLGHLE